jgi:hypothetical protein
MKTFKLFRLTVVFEIWITNINNHFDEYDRMLSRISINLCSFGETITSNSLLRNLLKPFLACAPFDLKCPFKKVKSTNYYDLDSFNSRFF